MSTLLNKIYRFYRYECCVPYSLSFLLVLVIFVIEFYSYHTGIAWASITSYVIISAYYGYNVLLYCRKNLISEDPPFFIGILTVKVCLWGFFLLLLLLVR